MFVRKAEAGSAPGYTWRAGEVLEIPDWLGEELLSIPRGGFSEAEASEVTPPEKPVETEAEKADDTETELTRGQKAAATRAANKAAAESVSAPESGMEHAGAGSTAHATEKPAETQE